MHRQPPRAYHSTLLRVAVCVLGGCARMTVRAQFGSGSQQYNESVAAAEQNVTLGLEMAPGLEEIYFPQLTVLPIDTYVPKTADSAAAYTQNVIFDPCRGYAYNCCNDTYGTPEFIAYVANPAATNYGTEQYYAADGSVMNKVDSRRPDDELYINEDCTGPSTPNINCVIARLAARPFPVMPQCWNYNASVVADKPCRAPADGSNVDLCIEVGITQTAFIVECGGQYATSSHCGTFLEVHRPGSDEVLAETRLRGMYTSGYRMSLISSTYKQAPNQVICSDPITMGRYEVWWIQRTLYNFVIEKTMPFTVVSPQCDWDAANNRYFPYATVATTVAASPTSSPDSTVDPFDPSLFRFSRPRTVGHAGLGQPGTGMGAVMVDATPDSFPPDAVFVDEGLLGETGADPLTYIYTPLPDTLYSVAAGYVNPPLGTVDVPPDQYDPLSATFTAAAPEPLIGGGVVSGMGGRRRRRQL